MLYLSIILAGMILALVIFLFLDRPMLRDIHRLSEATERISNGDLGYRAPVTGKDEVGRLSASFNLIAEQVEAQHREIERRRQELEVLNDELRTLNRNYMDMLGFVSHELKDPLTSAMLSLYTAKDGYLGELNPAQRKSLESTAQSLDYFQNMIRNYLDLSRLEKGELEVNKGQVLLQERVDLPALEAVERELQEHDINVDNRISESLVLNADVNLLRIVCDNLLSNAAKYGRSGGVILLDAQDSPHKVTLSVRNDGEGIPADKTARLFRKFSRLDGPESAGKRGTGLGLYISSEIVEKHGGEMWAYSQVGEWAKFSFTLPR